MRPTLTLRHYTHDLIAHSHDHAQLVFGLAGCLDFEVEGIGGEIRPQGVMVLPFSTHHSCGSPGAANAWCWMCPTNTGWCNLWANTRMPAGACWINRNG